jgi:hypothetical protein
MLIAATVGPLVAGRPSYPIETTHKHGEQTWTAAMRRLSGSYGVTCCRENDSTDDYARTGGSAKDRRFAEGSTVVSRRKADGTLVYLLLYSANYFASENCECRSQDALSCGHESGGRNSP